jgi:hypothetical protein
MKRFLVIFLLLTTPVFGQQVLKQSTATTINIGPFIDDTDFKTLETGLTVTSMTVKIIKQSDTFSSTNTSFSPTASGGSNDAQHVASGMYNLELTTTNTDTVGRLEVVITITGALPVFHRFLVIPATKWTEMVATGPSSIDDLNETDCSTIASTTSPMGKICANVTGPTLRYTVAGTSDSGSTTTMVDAARTEADTDYWAGSFIVFTSGNLDGQVRYITGFTPASDTITFAPATTQAVSTQNYEIRAGVDFLRPTVSGRTLDVTSTGGAGVDWSNVEAPTSTVTLSGTTVGTATNLTNLPTIPTNWVTANGINADAFTAAKFAADASTEFATTFMGTVIEGTTTMKQSAQYWNSALVGKYNSSAGTFNFRDIGDTKNRVVYTTTATSRATVTLSPD